MNLAEYVSDYLAIPEAAADSDADIASAYLEQAEPELSNDEHLRRTMELAPEVRYLRA
jgi:hypothetical protein